MQEDSTTPPVEILAPCIILITGNSHGAELQRSDNPSVIFLDILYDSNSNWRYNDERAHFNSFCLGVLADY